MRIRASWGEFGNGDSTGDREGNSKDELREELAGDGKELSANQIVYNIRYAHEIQAR